ILHFIHSIFYSIIHCVTIMFSFLNIPHHMYGDCCKSHLGSDGVFLRELNLSIKLNTIVANVIAVPAIQPKTIALLN
ncbi:hypothetical protein ACSI00_004840, partial [Escherichia coli]